MAKILENAYCSTDIQEKSAHYHHCHQLIFITKGTVEFCVNNAKQRVGAGNILILSRFENHSVTVLSEAYTRYVLHIGANVAGVQNHIFSLLFNRPRGFCNTMDVSEKATAFQWLFDRIVEEYHRPDRLSEDMQQLLLQQLLIMLYRQQPDLLTFDPVVYAIQQRFERDTKEQYDLCRLAKEYNVSVSSLSHRFKTVTGATVMGYLLECRLSQAKSLLASSPVSIGEIVEKCGFSDNSNFSRTFKRLTGLSPTQFRKKYQ